MIATLVTFILGFLRDLVAPMLSAPRITGKVASGTNPLIAATPEALSAKLRSAGLLLCVASLLGGCGIFDRPKEIVVARLFPLEDWPGGFPILAQDEVLVMLPDGTIGTCKGVAGSMVLHPSEVKGLLKK